MTLSTLEPGACRALRIPVLVCRCARCEHGWLVIPRDIGAKPVRPDRCPRCDARTWDQRNPRGPGRPRKAA